MRAIHRGKDNATIEGTNKPHSTGRVEEREIPRERERERDVRERERLRLAHGCATEWASKRSERNEGTTERTNKLMNERTSDGKDKDIEREREREREGFRDVGC